MHALFTWQFFILFILSPLLFHLTCQMSKQSMCSKEKQTLFHVIAKRFPFIFQILIKFGESFFSVLARQFTFATKTLLRSIIKKSTKTLILIYFIRFLLLLLGRQLPLFCCRNRLFSIFNALADFEHHLAVANCNM